MLDGGKFICHKVRLQQNVGRKKNLEQKNKIKKKWWKIWDEQSIIKKEPYNKWR